MAAIPMHLVEPSSEYEASYRNYLVELGDEKRIPYPLTYRCDPFDQLVENLRGQSLGVGVADGFVPNSTFWLISNSVLVGVSNLRHTLTPSLEVIGGHIGYGVLPSARCRGIGTSLLQLTILEAEFIGLKRVLLTCEKKNVGSARVIVANGGILENEIVDRQTGKLMQRYWIETSSSCVAPRRD